ncbi:hypothetical protein [Streptomyces sp. NPDC059862]|uniref:hypothetical protein n=1 Tax=unclassified Streptomyces TaxID=2593676 RepID=UPI00363FA396
MLTGMTAGPLHTPALWMTASSGPQERQEGGELPAYPNCVFTAFIRHRRRLEEAVQADVVLKYRREEGRDTGFQPDLLQPRGPVLGQQPHVEPPPSGGTITTKGIRSVTFCAQSIVNKRTDALYVGGLSSGWVKWRQRHTTEAVVIGVTDATPTAQALVSGRPRGRLMRRSPRDRGQSTLIA